MAKARRRTSTRKRRKPAPDLNAGGLTIHEIENLQQELARLRSAAQPSRWNPDADNVRRSVAKLVLTLVEFIRRVLERQAIRRHEEGTMTPDETERVGMALMRLEETIAEMAQTFGLDPQDLNMELGPLGKLY